MTTGFLHVAKEFGCRSDAQAGEKSENARGCVLRLRAQTVLAAVWRCKGGVILRDEIDLPGEPEAIPVAVRKHDRGGVAGGCLGIVNGRWGGICRGGFLRVGDGSDREKQEAKV